MNRGKIPTVRIAANIILCCSLCSCYFFRNRVPTSTDVNNPAQVVGQSLGEKAGIVDTASLGNIHGTLSVHPPAGIRPDPDVFVRRLLLQYRAQGSTVAREIGRVEEYRLLLGGASQDFSTDPQLSFDATSLLSKLKVAEEICRGLVDPNPDQHPGWATILPDTPANADGNIRFLAQRILGKPSSSISTDLVDGLINIMNVGSNGGYSYSDYVPVCAALLIDAEALLL